MTYRAASRVGDVEVEIDHVPLSDLATSAFGEVTWLDGDGHSELGATSYLGLEPVETIRGPIEELPRLVDAHATFPRWIGNITYEGEYRLARFDALIRQRAGRTAIVAVDQAAAHRLQDQLVSVPTDVSASIHGLQSTPRDQHVQAIERARQHIAAGDIYQVNLARRWNGAFEGEPLGLFLAMRTASPVPLGFYQRLFDETVCARTMERFLRWDPDASGRGTLECRPIKGTVRREGNDDAEAESLRNDSKEHAEHAMIVDLMRNDLGRVAEIGSVHVDDAFRVEPYAKLQHLVSTVRCTTRSGTTLRDVLQATFPPGSITGAPKIRAMEIIADLEDGPRGAYCGALGYVGRSVELAVAIRTAVIRDGRVTYHAGGGLVWASDPEREVAETELKARAFLDAIESLP